MKGEMKMKKISVSLLAAMTALSMTGTARAELSDFTDFDSLQSAESLEAEMQSSDANELWQENVEGMELTNRPGFGGGHGGPGFRPGPRPGPGPGGPGFRPGPRPGFPNHPAPRPYPRPYPIYPRPYPNPYPRPYPNPYPHLYTCYARSGSGYTYSSTDYSPSTAQYEAMRQCNMYSNYCSSMGCN